MVSFRTALVAANILCVATVSSLVSTLCEFLVMVTFDFFREGITASLVELGTKEVLVL